MLARLLLLLFHFLLDVVHGLRPDSRMLSPVVIELPVGEPCDFFGKADLTADFAGLCPHLDEFVHRCRDEAEWFDIDGPQ